MDLYWKVSKHFIAVFSKKNSEKTLLFCHRALLKKHINYATSINGRLIVDSQ